MSEAPKPMSGLPECLRRLSRTAGPEACAMYERWAAEVEDAARRLSDATATPQAETVDVGDQPSLRWSGHEVFGDFASLDAVRKAIAATDGTPADQPKGGE